MLFQPELAWSVLGLLGWSADSARRAPLQKRETKGISGARPGPLRCLSQFFPVEEKINRSRNEELAWSVLGLLGWSADSARRAPLQKRETKGISGARPGPLRCLSQFFPVEEKINRSRNEVLCIC